MFLVYSRTAYRPRRTHTCSTVILWTGERKDWRCFCFCWPVFLCFPVECSSTVAITRTISWTPGRSQRHHWFFSKSESFQIASRYCSCHLVYCEVLARKGLMSGWRAVTICLIVFNPLNPELNSICYLLALLGAHHFLHVSRIRVKSLTFRRLMSYIYGTPILDVSRSHTTTQHSR